MIQQKLFQWYINVAISLFLLLGIILTYSLKYISYIYLTIFVFLGFIFYIVIKPYLNEPKNNVLCNSFYSSKILLNLTIDIVFYIIYSLSVITFLYDFDKKSFSYFLLISICSALIAVQILILPIRLTSILMKLAMLAFNNLILSQLIYPFGVSASGDSDYHIFKLTIPIIQFGHVPLGTYYSYFPGHQIFSAIASIVTSISPEFIYLFMGSAIMAFAFLFIFIIGYKFIDARFALMSSLIYINCDYIILFANHPFQMTYTLPLVFLAYFLVFSLQGGKRSEYVILLLIVTVSLIFAHYFTTIILLFMLLALLISESILNLQIHKRIYRRDIVSFGIILIFIISFLSHWLFYSNMFNQFINIINIYYIAIRDPLNYIAPPTIFDKLSYKFLFIKSLGSNILMFFSTIGFFIFLKRRRFFEYGIMSITLTLLCLIALGIAINTLGLLSDRLYASLQGLSLIYLSAFALISIMQSSTSIYMCKRKILLLFIVFSIFSFFSNSSPIALGSLSPFIDTEPSIKLYETEQEHSSYNWLISHNLKNLDVYLSGSFKFNSTNITYPRLPIIFSPNINNLSIDKYNLSNNSFILFSLYDLAPGFILGRTSGKQSNIIIKLNPLNLILLDSYQKYYDNSKIRIYYKFY